MLAYPLYPLLAQLNIRFSNHFLEFPQYTRRAENIKMLFALSRDVYFG